MPFKTILVPTEQHDLMSSTLETAVVLARKFDSYIEGFALRVGVPVAFTIGDMGTLPVPAALEHEITDNENRTRDLFEEFMREHSVPGGGHTNSLSSGWVPDAPQGDHFVGSHGRVFDVIVLGSTWSRPQGPAHDHA